MSKPPRTCSTPGCGKPAAMSCPTCKELGAFDDAAFCGKECFQGFWPVHKLVHKRYKEAQAQALAMIAASLAMVQAARDAVQRDYCGVDEDLAAAAAAPAAEAEAEEEAAPR